MSDGVIVDPLTAAQELNAYILNEHDEAGTWQGLALRIDSLVFALRYLDALKAAPIESQESKFKRPADRDLRPLIGKRFSNLGLYWQALCSDIGKNPEATMGTGDAIDDLIDISKELSEVNWFLENRGRQEALAALRWRYEEHLYGHLIPLRAHLEELIHDP